MEYKRVFNAEPKKFHIYTFRKTMIQELLLRWAMGAMDLLFKDMMIGSVCFVMLKCKPEQSVKTQEGGQMKDFPVIGMWFKYRFILIKYIEQNVNQMFLF